MKTKVEVIDGFTWRDAEERKHEGNLEIHYHWEGTIYPRYKAALHIDRVIFKNLYLEEDLTDEWERPFGPFEPANTVQNFVDAQLDPSL